MCPVCCVMWPRFKCSNFHSWFIQTLHENELLNARKWGKCFHRKNLTRVTGLLYHHYWTREHCWSHRHNVCQAFKFPLSAKVQRTVLPWLDLNTELRLDWSCWREAGGEREAGKLERIMQSLAATSPESASVMSESQLLSVQLPGHSWYTEARGQTGFC